MKTKINPHGLKATDIQAAMSKKWTAPEWAIMWEVAQGTGASSGRVADAVMMSLWPSRGLELHGVEIKVSRSDWKREAADPTKAEAIARYCDQWWIHTPEGVVDDISDMPPAWGLREWSGKQWRTKKEAVKTEAEPMNRTFLASLLRRSEGAMKQMAMQANKDALDDIAMLRKEQHESYQKNIQRAVDSKTREFDRLKDKIESFESAFGIDVGDHLSGSEDMAAIGRIAKALNDVNGHYRSNAKKADDLETAAKVLRELHSFEESAA